MAPVSDQLGSDLPGALEAIRSSVIASNPRLYRHEALYLQVLRDTLPLRVERACFHLATRYQTRRYLALEEGRRRDLRLRIARLVRQCSSLLTVEQLAVLAAQMAGESGRRRRLAHRRLLERLASAASMPPTMPSLRSPLPGGDGDEDPDAASPDPGERPGWRDSGSVLPFTLPFSVRVVDNSPEAVPEPAVEPLRAEAPARPEAGAGQGVAALPPEPPDGREEDRSEGLSLDGEADDPRPWQQGHLPQDPLALLRWLDGMDQALQRRLRNLSHAINVELLRAGLNPTLLPVSLLDAALLGRVDSAQAPPHLLLLPLPFGVPGLPDGLPAMALLLRTADLELEEPRLRTCRRRLQHHRQELRRMADRFRRLQRRLDLHQAERLWLQDLPPQTPATD